MAAAAETFCNHDDRDRRLLRVSGFDTPQMVCEACWRDACEKGKVDR